MRYSGNPQTASSGHRPLHPGQPVAQTVAYAVAPRLSSRNLDLCLLAVCSCVLTVLCHQTIPTPFSASSSSTASAMTASSTSPSHIAFTLKAGLFTTSQQKDGTELNLQQEEE